MAKVGVEKTVKETLSPEVLGTGAGFWIMLAFGRSALGQVAGSLQKATGWGAKTVGAVVAGTATLVFTAFGMNTKGFLSSISYGMAAVALYDTVTEFVPYSLPAASGS